MAPAGPCDNLKQYFLLGHEANIKKKSQIDTIYFQVMEVMEGDGGSLVYIAENAKSIQARCSSDKLQNAKPGRSLGS